jgi:hypothetical protein
MKIARWGFHLTPVRLWPGSSVSWANDDAVAGKVLVDGVVHQLRRTVH